MSAFGSCWPDQLGAWLCIAGMFTSSGLFQWGYFVMAILFIAITWAYLLRELKS